MKNLQILLCVIALGLVIRFYNIETNPPSLYWDEASLGYNAYSILKTGSDEHGTFLPVTNFAAFGDYKPPLYIYSIVPSVALFGLTELAVRFPSALFGTLMVLLTYFITKILLDRDKIALLTSLSIAISPWHVQLSRAGFEANMAAFLSLGAITLFIKGQKTPILLVLSSVFFVLAMYTFTGQRLFVPIIVLVLLALYRTSLIKNYKYTLIAAFIAILMLMPLLNFSRTIEGRLRFDEVTIFKDLKPINDSIDYRKEDGFSAIANIIHNRRIFFTHEYLKHYFDAFNPKFLFVTGDQNPRFSSQATGQLFYVDILLVPLGIYFLFSRKFKSALFIILWLLISPLGQATARETPHALRMAHILPTFQIISAIGIYFLMIKNFRFKKILISTIFILFFIQLVQFTNYYYEKYPTDYSKEWQFGYKETVEFSNSYYNDVDKIIVSDFLGRPYIYYAFYTRYDPLKFQKNAYFKRDQFYFYNVEGFDKYIFTGDVASYSSTGKNLFVTSAGNLPSNTLSLKKIYNLNNEPIFEIGVNK